MTHRTQLPQQRKLSQQNALGAYIISSRSVTDSVSQNGAHETITILPVTLPNVGQF